MKDQDWIKYTDSDDSDAHSRELSSDASLPDGLNNFYARFMARKNEAFMRAPADPDACVIMLSIGDVSKTFKQVNIHKAMEQDRLPGHILRTGKCLHWNVILSLTESVIPTCFNQTAMVPVPNNEKVTWNSFERLVMVHINTSSWNPKTQSNLQTAPKDPQVMQSELHSTLPFPTCTKGTPMWECC